METKHCMLVATELSTEDLLEIFVVLAKNLASQRDRALADAVSWKREFEMYRSAWLREMGGVVANKHHDIDAFVVRARNIYQEAMAWRSYQNGLAGRDPFWMVQEPSRELEAVVVDEPST